MSHRSLGNLALISQSCPLCRRSRRLWAAAGAFHWNAFTDHEVTPTLPIYLPLRCRLHSDRQSDLFEVACGRSQVTHGLQMQNHVHRPSGASPALYVRHRCDLPEELPYALRRCRLCVGDDKNGPVCVQIRTAAAAATAATNYRITAFDDICRNMQIDQCSQRRGPIAATFAPFRSSVSIEPWRPKLREFVVPTGCVTGVAAAAALGAVFAPVACGAAAAIAVRVRHAVAGFSSAAFVMNVSCHTVAAESSHLSSHRQAGKSTSAISVWLDESVVT